MTGTIINISAPVQLGSLAYGIPRTEETFLTVFVYIKGDDGNIYQCFLSNDELDLRHRFFLNFGRIMMANVGDLVNITEETRDELLIVKHRIYDFYNLSHPEYNQIV